MEGPQLCCLHCWPLNQQPNPDKELGDQKLSPTTALGRMALLTTRPCSWQPAKHIWPLPRASRGSHRQPSSSCLAPRWQLSDHPGRAAGRFGDRRLLQHQRKVLARLQAGNGCSPGGGSSSGLRRCCLAARGKTVGGTATRNE